MKRIIDDIGAALRFMQKGVLRFEKNASLVPSSPFLIEAMVESAPLERAHCVVEFGPGTGGVTKAILKRLPASAHLHAIELDGHLLGATTRRVSDSRLRPIHGSAADAPALIRDGGCPGHASVVFSSLGLSLMADPLRESILAGARGVLAPGGVFVQYVYLHAKAFTYQFGQGWSRFDGEEFLRRHFHDIESRIVLRNVPPAAVFVCSRAVRAARHHDKRQAKKTLAMS